MAENIEYSSSSSDSSDGVLYPISDEDSAFDYIDATSYSGIMKDVLFNDIEAVSQKIREGKSVRVVDNVGNTLLHLAISSCERGELSMINFLLDQEEIDIDTPNYIHRTPLLDSIKRKKRKVALHLIERGAKIEYPEAIPPLHEACRYGLPEVAKCIIEKGVDVNSLDRDNDTPLHVAVYYRQLEMVCLLLYYGAEMLENDENLTPTDLSLQSGAMEIAKVLVDYTARSANTKINLALHYRHKNLHQEVERIIMDREEDDTYFYPGMGEWCSLQKKPEALELILNNFVLQCSMKELVHRIFECPKINWQMFRRNLMVIMQLKEDKLIELTDKVHGLFLSLIIVGYCSLKKNIDLFDRQFLHEFSFVLISHGLEVWDVDLDVVYQLFGFCDFFKMLLQMDVKQSGHMPKFNIIPYLMMDVNYKTSFWEKFQSLERYFEDCPMQCFDHEVWCSYTRRTSLLPKLADISRNKARDFICKRYKIKNCHQFYYLLNHACLPPKVKKLLSFNIPLYGEEERSNCELQKKKWKFMRIFIVKHKMSPYEKRQRMLYNELRYEVSD